jgi:hypothetical protein
VDVVLADRDHQAEVGLDHQLLGLVIVVVDDAPAQLLLLVGAEQRDLVDLLQVELEIGLQALACHARPWVPTPVAG